MQSGLTALTYFFLGLRQIGYISLCLHTVFCRSLFSVSKSPIKTRPHDHIYMAVSCCSSKMRELKSFQVLTDSMLTGSFATSFQPRKYFSTAIIYEWRRNYCLQSMTVLPRTCFRRPSVSAYVALFASNGFNYKHHHLMTPLTLFNLLATRNLSGGPGSFEGTSCWLRDFLLTHRWINSLPYTETFHSRARGKSFAAVFVGNTKECFKPGIQQMNEFSVWKYHTIPFVPRKNEIARCLCRAC